MIKNEKMFVSLETDEKEIKIGKPVVLVLHGGVLIKTSPVENWFHNRAQHSIVIETRNTVYRRYFD